MDLSDDGPRNSVLAVGDRDPGRRQRFAQAIGERKILGELGSIPRFDDAVDGFALAGAVRHGGIAERRAQPRQRFLAAGRFPRRRER